MFVKAVMAALACFCKRIAKHLGYCLKAISSSVHESVSPQNTLRPQKLTETGVCANIQIN